MEDCSKTSAAGAVVGLPDDLLVEILSRVPAKSICRFKCVSKAWRDLIADPCHRKKLPQAMQGLFIMTPKYSEDEDPVVCHDFSFGFIDLTGGLEPLGIDPSFSFLKKLPWIQILVLMDSCNGLILFENCPEPFSDAMSYVVCNPTTKQWVALPTCGSPEQMTYTYMAFDASVSSHFHLVQFQIPYLEKELTSVHAYSSETGTWSPNRILLQEGQGQLTGWHHRVTLGNGQEPWCAFVNGFLYLTVRDSDHQNKIAVVDVQGNAIRMIAMPKAARGVYLGQSQGRLHYMTQKPLDADEELSIWVLQDSHTQEWVLKDSVSSLKLFGEKSCSYSMTDLEVVGIHPDCNTIFCTHSVNHKLVAYNMDSREVSVIGTFKDSDRWTGIGRFVPYFSESPTLTA